MMTLLDEYPELVSKVDISKHGSPTRKGYYLKILRFGYKSTSPRAESILIDGAHHSRELTSVQMVSYTMLRTLYDHELENDSNGVMHTFFKSHNIYFIPVVNIDGFEEIAKYWTKHHQLEYVRKNMK